MKKINYTLYFLLIVAFSVSMLRLVQFSGTLYPPMQVGQCFIVNHETMTGFKFKVVKNLIFRFKSVVIVNYAGTVEKVLTLPYSDLKSNKIEKVDCP
jgi:hypothetical protein